jgi:hypothetical protein
MRPSAARKVLSIAFSSTGLRMTKLHAGRYRESSAGPIRAKVIEFWFEGETRTRCGIPIRVRRVSDRR